MPVVRSVQSQENGTAEHADGSGASKGQDDAFYFEARLAKVEQQAEMRARGFQIIQPLRPMNLIDRFGDFQFDKVTRPVSRLNPSSQVSIRVFCVFCGSIFLS